LISITLHINKVRAGSKPARGGFSSGSKPAREETPFVRAGCLPACFVVIIMLWLGGLTHIVCAQSLLPDTICGQTGERSYFVSGWSNSTYTWTVEGGLLLPPGNTESITVDWTGVPPGNYTITVVEHSADGCSGDPYSDIVHIFPAPEISFSLCTPITSRDAIPYSLRGGIPLNGIYSGTGVQSGIFYPGQVPPIQDTVIIWYYYTNSFGCPDADSAILQLHPAANHTCGNPFTDVRDGTDYSTVQLGNRCWMAENLNYGTHISSTTHHMNNCQPEKYCYDETTANCTNFGGLYQWDELMDYQDVDTVQGLCPPGWHISTETEWQELITLFQDAAHAGTALKEGGSSGFQALLSGFWAAPGLWSYGASDTTLNSALFWTSSSTSTGKALAHGMNSVVNETGYTTSVSTYSSSWSNALPVRCVKD